jgi:hypothetical protein
VARGYGVCEVRHLVRERQIVALVNHGWVSPDRGGGLSGGCPVAPSLASSRSRVSVTGRSLHARRLVRGVGAHEVVEIVASDAVRLGESVGERGPGLVLDRRDPDRQRPEVGVLERGGDPADDAVARVWPPTAGPTPSPTLTQPEPALHNVHYRAVMRSHRKGSEPATGHPKTTPNPHT